MKFSDEGIIINLKKYGEKSLIIKIFTRNHGVHRGFVKYANANKNNTIFQIGNLISFEYVAKNEDNLGSFLNFDLCENNSAKFIFDKLRINCAKSAISIIDNYFLERESFNFLYQHFEKFLCQLGNGNIKDGDIIANYVKLELLILESLGYGIDLSSCIVTNSTINLAYVSPKSARAVSIEAGAQYADKLLKLPFFLLANNNYYNDDDLKNIESSPAQETAKLADKLEDQHLFEGLKLSGFFLKKFLFAMGDETHSKQGSIYRDNIIKSFTQTKN